MQSMAKVEDFLNKGRKEPTTEGNAQGSFACQECDLVVNRALFDDIEGIISWTCPEGHKSQVKF